MEIEKGRKCILNQQLLLVIIYWIRVPSTQKNRVQVSFFFDLKNYGTVVIL